MLDVEVEKQLRSFAAGAPVHRLTRTDVRLALEELARLQSDNAHLRQEKRLFWAKTNAPLGTCHDAAL